MNKNEPKQAKATQNETQTDPERAKTSQHNPKKAKTTQNETQVNPKRTKTTQNKNQTHLNDPKWPNMKPKLAQN